MRIFLTFVLLLLVAGCSSTTNLVTEHEDKSTSQPPQMINDSTLEPSPKLATPEERADPRTTGVKVGLTGEKSGSLMDCDETCRRNCSPKNQSKPKWCTLYKPPAS